MHGELSLASYNIKVLDLKVLVRWHQHMIPRLQGCKYSSTNCHIPLTVLIFFLMRFSFLYQIACYNLKNIFS